MVGVVVALSVVGGVGAAVVTDSIVVVGIGVVVVVVDVVGLVVVVVIVMFVVAGSGIVVIGGSSVSGPTNERGKAQDVFSVIMSAVSTMLSCAGPVFD